MVIQAKVGASPARRFKVRQRCGAPIVGSVIEARPCDQFGKGSARWERWAVRAIANGTHLLEKW